MLESELKHLWKTSAVDFQVDVERLTKAYAIEKKWDRFDRKIYWRNIREYVAAASVVVGMGYYLLYLPLPTLSKIGCGFIFIWCFYYVYQLWSTRVHKKSPSLELSLLEELKAVKNYLEREEAYLKSTFHKVLLPCLIGMGLFYAGQMGALQKNPLLWWSGTTGSVAVAVFIWWLNQQVVKRRYQPIIRELTELISAWE